MPEPAPQYLSIKNWHKYQPKLKNGNPRRDWIRLDTNRVDDPEFLPLGFFSRGVLTGIMELKGRTGKNPPNDVTYLARAMHTIPTDRPHLRHTIDTLLTRGFLILSNQQIEVESALQDKTGQDKTYNPLPPSKPTSPNAPVGVPISVQEKKQKPSNGNGWKPSEHWPPAPPMDGVKLEDSMIQGRFLAVSKLGKWIQLEVSH